MGIGCVGFAHLWASAPCFASVRFNARIDGHDVTGLGFVIEVQLDTTSLKLPQYVLDATLDEGMIGAIASDELLNNRPKRGWRQAGVWDTHFVTWAVLALLCSVL